MLRKERDKTADNQKRTCNILSVQWCCCDQITANSLLSCLKKNVSAKECFCKLSNYHGLSNWSNWLLLRRSSGFNELLALPFAEPFHFFAEIKIFMVGLMCLNFGFPVNRYVIRSGFDGKVVFTLCEIELLCFLSHWSGFVVNSSIIKLELNYNSEIIYQAPFTSTLTALHPFWFFSTSNLTLCPIRGLTSTSEMCKNISWLKSLECMNP